jgi:hypothetical protein
MSAVIASLGTVSDEQTVDNDVCTCCRTSLVKTWTGFVASYCNHTSDEIRDIYTVRDKCRRVASRHISSQRRMAHQWLPSERRSIGAPTA